MPTLSVGWPQSGCGASLGTTSLAYCSSAAQHAGHVVDRVVAQMRLRAVRGDARASYSRQRAAPLWATTTLSCVGSATIAASGTRGKSCDRPAGGGSFRSVAAVGQLARIGRRPVRRPGEAVLFVDRAGHDDGRPARRLFLGQPRHGRDHRRHAALDVARPAAIQPAAVDLGRERLDRHAFDGHRVLMGLEHHDLAAALRRHVAIDARDDVVAQRRDRVPLDRQSQPAKQRLQVARHAVLVIDVAA